MWILHMEQTDGCIIMHARNGREFRLPELPATVSTVIAQKPKRSTNFGDVLDGCKFRPLRDFETLGGDTFAERYERTMSRNEQITAAGYTVKLIWECEFDAAKIVE